MDLSIISLLFLAAAIAIGFIMKRNIGFIAIAMALILGWIAGIDDKIVISGFNVNLFMMLLGVSYLFTIAENNRTLEIVCRKTIALVGKKINLIPFVLVALGTVVSMTGPGTIAALALMAMLSTALSKELDIDPLPFAVCGFVGAAAGGMSPVSPTGIIAMNLAAQQGYSGMEIPYMLTIMVGALLFGVAFYFTARVFKVKSPVEPCSLRDVQPLNRGQWITLAGIVVMFVLVLFFKVNVGLASFLVAGILNLGGVCEERKVFISIPWSTLIMVCGVGVLMNLIIELGGIDQLSSGIASLMTPYTAPPLIALAGGIMSWFSSTSGVVIPTLVPTVPGIIENLSGAVTPLSLISALSAGSQMAGVSPASTGGALALAAYVALFKPDTAEKNHYFLRLFLTSVYAVLFMVALGFLGFFTWIR